MTDQANNTQVELTETQQKMIDEFFVQTARKIVPVTILGEKAAVVFRHVFGFVDEFQYGLDETGNVVVQDMPTGNYAVLRAEILCSLVSAYSPELQKCKKEQIIDVAPDLMREAGLLG